jgi:toxin ParE1/3/4
MSLPAEESEFIPCDVEDIVRRLRRRDPGVADRFVEEFKSTVELLSGMPHLGRPRPDLGAPGMRSWRVGSFRNFLLFYEVLPDRLQLLRVLHGYRDLQEIFKQ